MEPLCVRSSLAMAALLTTTSHFSPKSSYLPLVIYPHWVHLFDFGKLYCADIKQALLPVLKHESIKAASASFHGSKHHVVGKITKSGSLKSAIFRRSRLLPRLPLDSAWNLNSTLTRKFGSTETSLSSYSEWKSSKITDSPPPAWCSLGQISTPE